MGLVVTAPEDATTVPPRAKGCVGAGDRGRAGGAGGTKRSGGGGGGLSGGPRASSRDPTLWIWREELDALLSADSTVYVSLPAPVSHPAPVTVPVPVSTTTVVSESLRAARVGAAAGAAALDAAQPIFSN